MREYLFDDWRSIFHFILGMIVPLISKVSLLLSVIVVSVYVIYQVLDEENAINTIGDIVEFMVGFMIGLLWWW